MAKLATFVHVTNDRGVSVAFGPDDEVPEWAQSLITNPKAWAEPPTASRLAVPTPAPAKKTAAKRATPRRKGASNAPVHGD